MPAYKYFTLDEYTSRLHGGTYATATAARRALSKLRRISVADRRGCRALIDTIYLSNNPGPTSFAEGSVDTVVYFVGLPMTKRRGILTFLEKAEKAGLSVRELGIILRKAGAKLKSK